MPRYFWKTDIVTDALPIRDSEIKEQQWELKRQMSYKAREQKLRWEAAVIGELKREYEF